MIASCLDFYLHTKSKMYQSYLMIDDADDAYDNTHVFQFVILRKRYYLKAKNGFNSLKLTQIE